MIFFFLNSFHPKNNKSKYINWILLFCLLINLPIFICDIDSCKSNSNLGNSDCFNNIIKIEGNKYRAGRFETTKDGGLIIEYSEDSQPGGGRLFYRLTKEGRGYYEGDNPFRTFDISKQKNYKDESGSDIVISSRYEARNKLVVLDGDTTQKEYLFSTSSWYSFTELHDLETGNYSAWFTPDFFGIGDKYIFSYHYEILSEPNSYNYFIIYCQYDRQEGGKAFSESYFIRKFNLKFFNESNPYNEIKQVSNSDNSNIRTISAFIMEKYNILVIFFLKEDDNLILRTYDFNLENPQDIITVGETKDYVKGEGPFFRALNLDDDHAAVIYYPKCDQNNGKIVFQIYKYNNGFSSVFRKELSYTLRSALVIKNEFYRIRSNRLIFITKENKFYIYLFDLFDNYSKIILNIYEYAYTNYDITKDMSFYYFNGYVYFTGTIEVDNGDRYSVLITFGYSEGEDSVIDISPYLADSNNTDISLNLFSYFLSSSIIDNNIFNYTLVDKVKLVTIKFKLSHYFSLYIFVIIKTVFKAHFFQENKISKINLQSPQN